MKKMLYVIIIIIASITFILSSILIVAEQGSLKKVSDERMKVISRSNAQAVLYNALQENQLAVLNGNNAKYNAEGVLEEQNVLPDLDVVIRRDMLKTPMKINQIHKDLSKDVYSEDIAIAFDTIDGTKTDVVKMATIGNEKIIIPNDPDTRTYNFTSAENNSYGIIWTEKGMWKISTENRSASKITDDRFNGKTYNDLRKEVQDKSSDDSKHIYWNYNPKISKLSDTIIYTTNRETWQQGGNSIWIFKNNENKENVLIKNTQGEYYSIIGWCDKEAFIYAKYTDGRKQYFVSNSLGLSSDLKLEGSNPDILHLGDGVIAYLSEQNTQNQLIISSLNPQSGSTAVISKYIFDGRLRLPCAGFSPNSNKYAFLYAPNDNPTIRRALVININDNIMSEIKEKNFTDIKIIKSIYGVEWNNDSELLILSGDENNVSTWLYNTEVK